MDWWGVLGAIDARRASALEALDDSSLGEYTEPDSPAWAADVALLDELRAHGLRPVGLVTRLIDIRPFSAHLDDAELRVVDERSAYDLVDASDEVVASRPATGPRAWSVRLRRHLGIWRLIDVVPAVDPEVS